MYSNIVVVAFVIFTSILITLVIGQNNKQLNRISTLKCVEYQNFASANGFIPNNCQNYFGSKGDGLPHMAAIYTKDYDSDLNYLCAGSLISDRFVLTVASCLWQPEPHFVKIGTNKKQAKFHPIEYTIGHENYTHGIRNKFNIGLIKLRVPINFERNVMPACLPRDDSHLRKAFYMESIGSFFNNDNKIHSPVMFDTVERNKCHQRFIEREIFNGADQVVCVGELNGQNAKCSGDLGEPLQLYSSEVSCMFTIYGIDRVCGINYFSRIVPHLNWIESKVWRTIN